jgi:putative membrane associated peptidase
MEQIVINKNDELVMKLLHYFITEMGYSPIVLHGAKDEIWLEKLDGDYQIVRIVSNYIHNNDQLNFDLFRTRQIMKQIKKKTFSFNMNTLSLFVNLGDNVDINQYLHTDNIDCASIQTIQDFNKYSFITESFPTITKKTTFKEKGADLFLKITGEITKKNEQESIKAEEVFKVKRPYITYALLVINAIIFFLVHWNPQLLNNLVLLKNINSEYYRIITAAFTHYDIFHLLFNMYALYVIGSQIESFFGKKKYMIIYLFSIITSSLMSITFMPNNGASLGASGAIFGLFGSLIYFGYHYRLYLGTVLRSQVIPLIIFNLLLGFMITGVDNAAHIGGLIGGILISMACGVKYKSTKSERINGCILSIILLTFLTYISFM